MKTWFASFIFTAITSCLVLFANFEYKLGGGSHAASLILMAIFWSTDFIWLIIILISKAKNNYQQKKYFNNLAEHLIQSSKEAYEEPTNHENSMHCEGLTNYKKIIDDKDLIDEEFNDSIDKAALKLTGKELDDFIDKALKDYVNKKRKIGKIK